jgi:hypothetical protein
MEKIAVFALLFAPFVGLGLLDILDQQKKRVSALKYNYLWVYNDTSYGMNIMLDQIHV